MRGGVILLDKMSSRQSFLHMSLDKVSSLDEMSPRPNVPGPSALDKMELSLSGYSVVLLKLRAL